MDARARVAAALVAVGLLARSGDAAAQPEREPEAGAEEEQPPAVETPSRGWTDPRALELAKEAILAKKEGRLHDCTARDRESLEIEDHPYVRLHLASCFAGVARVLDALREAKLALEAGLRSGDRELSAAAASRVKELLARVAHVRFLRRGKGPAMTFDGVPLTEQMLTQRITVEPGYHLLEIDGEDCIWSKRDNFSIDEGEEKTIELPTGDARCPDVTPLREERVVVTLGLETSAYTDTNRVNVLTPAVNAAASSSRGWDVAGSYLIDVISSASPDVVSTASPRFHETRHQVTARGGYKPGVAGVELSSKLSVEPDCVSIKGGGAVSLDLEDHTITPRIGYAHRFDRIGVRGTPFSELERNLSVNAFEAGATFLMSPSTLLVTSATVETMRGDASNPYRYVPIFSADVAPSISPGASGELVNATRLAQRPREQLPTERDRFALFARLNHRFESATLRLEERVYTDTWGIHASTTDARYLRDLYPRLIVGPHFRFHGQSGASFQQLAYVGGDPAGGAGGLPLYRTTARELSPSVALTGGATARVLLHGIEREETRISLLLSTDVTYARYFESLFVTSRAALYGTIGFEAEL